MNRSSFSAKVAATVFGLVSILPGVMGQSETGIIARSKLLVEGTVQGKTSVAIQGGQTSPTALPRLKAARKSAGTRALVIGGSDPVAKGDFASANDVAIRYTFQPVDLPPGAYGRLVVQGSRVVLGEAGAMRPSRYDFAAIEVTDGGRIDLAGPVIVTTDGFDKMDGVVGRADLPEWLDLRISGRPLTIGARSEVHGSLYAPESIVKLQPRSRVHGWVVGDDVRVERGSDVSAMRVPWSPGAPSSPHLAFPQRAVLVQERLGRFVAEGKGQVSANLDFSQEIPRVTLALTATRKNEKSEPAQRLLFFQGCTMTFGTGGLEQARVTMELTSSKAAPRAAAPEVVLTRSDFEALLWAIAQEKVPAEGIRKIEASPLLQTLFFERCVRMHGVSGKL